MLSSNINGLFVCFVLLFCPKKNKTEKNSLTFEIDMFYAMFFSIALPPPLPAPANEYQKQGKSKRKWFDLIDYYLECLPVYFLIYLINNKIIVIIISSSSVIDAAQLFKNCSSNSGHIQSINISDCSDNDSYCRLKKGGDVLMHLDFVAGKFFFSFFAMNSIFHLHSIFVSKQIKHTNR